MRTLVLVIVALCLNGLTDLAAARKQTPSRRTPLTVLQLEQLVTAHVPDAVVAKELGERGLGEDISRETIDALRQKGAGPQTIAALSTLLPRATLVLRTTPGADVSLGARWLGAASEAGELVRSDLEPGRVRLQIRKTDYITLDQVVELRRRGATTLDLPLAWAVGFLSIRVPQAQAQISVKGVGNYWGRVENLAVPPGTYRVTISAPSYETLDLDVTVVAGQTAAPEILLVFDQRRLLEFNSTLNGAFEQRQYARVVEVARQMQQLGILRPEGLSLAATSNWELRNYPAFLEMARSVLMQHGDVRVAVIHHHRILVPSHQAVLTVGTSTVQFQAQDICTVKSFSVSPQRIDVRSRTILGPENQNFIGLGFEYPNLKNPAKKELVFFIMLDEAQKNALATLLAEAARLSTSS